MEFTFEFLNKEKGRSFSYRTAQVGTLLYSPSSETSSLVYVNSGGTRLIDPSKSFNSLTLAKSNSPQIFGANNLLGFSYDQEVRATTVCKYLSIEFSELLPEEIKQINSLFKSKIDLFELINIYSVFSRLNDFKQKKYRDPFSFYQDLEIINSLLDLDESEPILYLDKKSKGFNYGQIITTGVIKTFFDPDKIPRLIKYKPGLRESNDNLYLPTNKINYDTKLKESSLDLDLNKISTKKIDETNSNSDYDEDSKQWKFKKAFDQLGSFNSTIEMLVEYFDLPTRKDTIRKASIFITRENKNLNEKMLSILDQIGLSVRLIRVNLKQPQLLPIPSIWIDKKGNSSLIYKVTNNSIMFLNPLEGKMSFNLKDAQKMFTESPSIISVNIGLHTPKKRFSLAWLVPYVRRYRTQLIEVFAASFLTQIFALATPLLFQQIIDRVISKGAFDALSPLTILMIIFVILETLFSSLRTFQFVEISNRLDIGIGSAIMSRLLRLNARFFDKRPVGELSSRLGELENIRRFLTGTALTVVLDAIFSILYFLVMISYSPLLTLIVVLTIPPLFLVTVGITPITQRLIRKRAEATSKTQSLLVELLSGIQTIKLQNAEFKARRQWENRHLDSINQGFKAIIANTSSANALQLITKLSNIILIGVGAWLVINNELTLGQLIAFRIISGYVTQPMLRLASSWQNFQEMSLSLERVGDVVNQPLEIKENEEGAINIPDIQGSISFDSVSFHYNSMEAPVLSSVSLEIEKGSFVGLVGQSGCGKSSLLKMIPRLYNPSAGKIKVDGYDISKVDLYSLRSQIGFVPQDCMLFEGTVFSNIALGDPQAEADEVIKMSRIACAHDFIMSLPYGYNTPVGEKGSGLSGGQRQRIALARMLLEKPNLIILDEATSALDVDTERQVVDNLRSHFVEKSLLMITHRLSTLNSADSIVVMHDGRVDSIGKHKSLMSQKGRYFALYNSQFGMADQQ